MASITADREQGAYLATSHLLRCGRRPVALLGARYPGGAPEIERPELAGYRTAVDNALKLVWAGEKSAADALRDAKTQVDSLLAETYARYSGK